MLRYLVTGNFDISFKDTRQEWFWQDELHLYMDEIMSGQIMYTTPGEVKTPWVCNDMYRTYFF